MYLNFDGFMAECVLDRTKTIHDWKDNPDMWFAIKVNGTRYKYSEEEMNALWDAILIERKRIDNIGKVTDKFEAKQVNEPKIYDLSDSDLEDLDFT